VPAKVTKLIGLKRPPFLSPTIIHLLKILAFVATITAKNNYHGTNQKRENRFLTNQKATVIILAQ
jgi:hypothetical protein